MKEKLYRSILRTVGAYVIFSLLWIFASDRVLFLSVNDLIEFMNWQTTKGIFFVLSSSAFLFLILWRESRIRERSWQAHQQEREALIRQLEDSNLQLSAAWDATIIGWAQTIELRDAATRYHSERALAITLTMAKKMGITDPDELLHIRWGALLHDIGKIGIPDHILNKPDKLTVEEREIVNRHPVLGAELLSTVEHLRSSIDIPLFHHERWNGSGYPKGLQGEDIPLAARIFAVVDVWDAMTSDRPYRNAISEHDAIHYITAESGKHFDPQVVFTFLKILNQSNIDHLPGKA